MIRALFVSFFCLITLLLGINSSGYAEVMPTNAVKVSRDLHLVKTNNLSTKKEDCLSISNEDEDLACSRKQVLIQKSAVGIAQIFLLNHFYNYPKNRLPFCSHFSYTSSYKYILQRVLRI